MVAHEAIDTAVVAGRASGRRRRVDALIVAPNMLTTRVEGDTVSVFFAACRRHAALKETGTPP